MPRVRRVANAEPGCDGARQPALRQLGPRFRVRVEPFAPLGLRTAPHPTGLGEVVETDATGVTAVPGLYAAGNVTDPSQQVLQAAADGLLDVARRDLTELDAWKNLVHAGRAGFEDTGRASALLAAHFDGDRRIRLEVAHPIGPVAPA